eukprot:1762482-Amphidinium_carterae.1
MDFGLLPTGRSYHMCLHVYINQEVLFPEDLVSYGQLPHSAMVATSSQKHSCLLNGKRRPCLNGS